MSAKQKIFNPANGKLIAEVSVVSEVDVKAAIISAREAFDNGPWPKFSLEERKSLIFKISKGILDKAGELARLETLNTGKPIKESTFMDIPSSAETFNFFAENLKGFLLPEEKKITNQIAAVDASLIREPVGVVVLIVPWNYPLLIASWKVAQALSSGNTVILKPSSLTPLTALELEKIIYEAGLPEGVFKVLNGSGEKIGKALCSDKRVDMVSFTGSNEVGKRIVEYSAHNIKKLTLELGGKSASVVLSDCDLEAAVNGSLASIFLNQGQMCTAMSRILVEDKIYDKFVTSFLEKARRIKLGEGEDFQTQMGPLISDRQRKKVIEFIKQAVKEGAKILCGGNIPKDILLKDGFFFEPTVFGETSPKSNIFQQEVFGPVACINKFSSLQEAADLANTTKFGLAACIWSKDNLKIKELSTKINAGTIWVNTYGAFFNELPYGGFKQSGFGKELGREGFLEYTALKNIVQDKTEGAKPLVSYWYGF